MTADWNVIREYAIPLGASLLAGIVTWSLMLWLFRRMQGRDYRRARIIRVITLPAAFILPLLFLGVATEATPLAGKALAAVQHLLHLGIVGCVT
ncbi:mechanosensitive ion channel family protein, partial [Xanthomonas perforans]|nr:mechanosensitive ion channel family protein [Xanthomonas perforans]